MDRLNWLSAIEERMNKLEDNSENIIQNVHQKESEGKEGNELKKHRECDRMRKSKYT